jgi:ketosteroid isomerase-like protein
MKSNIAKRLLTIVVAGFTLGTLMLATAWADSVEDAIMARVAQFHAAATAADITAIADIVAKDGEAVAIGTDPNEVFQGHADIVAWWEGLFELLDGGLITQITETLQLDYRDVVGWVAQKGEWDLSSLGVPDPVPFRVTLVLEKRMGDWDIVQQHFSFGVPNPG